MTKSELLEAIAKESGLTKADSERALNAFTETVKKSLKKGNPVAHGGFWYLRYIGRERPEKGRNPQTGEAIKIAAATLPKFKPGKGLKDALARKR